MKYKIDRYHKLNIQTDQAESGLALLIGYTIYYHHFSKLIIGPISMISSEK
jgi:hypothetical protein